MVSAIAPLQGIATGVRALNLTLNCARQPGDCCNLDSTVYERRGTVLLTCQEESATAAVALSFADIVRLRNALTVFIVDVENNPQ